jgi:trehalose-6-phosphate synthase
MNILSYRGPSTAGGVSSALARIIETCADGDPRWWYINESSLEMRTSTLSRPEQMAKIPQEVIDGHYSYCNNFVWPILHDLPEQATLNLRDRRLYQQFNTRFARTFMRSRQIFSDQCFVNDYQLALATGLIAKSRAINIILFWHVPWPRSVAEEHAPYLAEIARGLLGARRIGFHTNEYATNFLRFVEANLSDYRVDFGSGSIINSRDASLVTELVALPLGLDFHFWLQTAAESSPLHKDLDVSKNIDCKFVLSVDRADYTKGVLERMEAIDHYFALNPHRIGKISFVQVCQPTRIGLPAFDKYWQQCRARGHELNARWQEGSWQPVAWIDKPVPPKVLAWLYRKAEAMLINPIRDGLNLTAKEFAVCSSSGALILSRGAGVWHELGANVVPLHTLSPGEMAAQIETSLTMPHQERVERLQAMKKTISANNLRAWWRNFELGDRGSQNVVPITFRTRKAKSGNTSLLLAK